MGWLDGAHVYLCGPVTGAADAQSRFARAERQAKADGAAIVCNPVRALGMHTGRTHEEYMRHCLHELTRGNIATRETEYRGVLLLPGWESSEGCRAEVATAKACGIKVVEKWLRE